MAGLESTDIRQFITDNAVQRFQMAGPLEFEWLVRELFVKDGYACTAGDLDDGSSGYFLAERDGYVMAVLPLLTVPGHEPPRETFDRAVNLREVHGVEYVSIVTTGDFKSDTLRLARKLGVEAWDWAKLESAIRELFFDGAVIPAAILSFSTVETGDEYEPELGLKAKWEARAGVTPDYYNLEIAVTNLSGRHRYLHFELPVIVDIRGRQIAAGEWVEGEFTAGTVYSGATVTANALFPVERVGDKPTGGRVMLSCHERLDVPVTYHLSGRLKGEACFAVTYCFGRDSVSYSGMTRFRDEVLSRTWPGRFFIEVYYELSPRLIFLVMQLPGLEKPFRWMTQCAIRCIVFFFPAYKQ